MHTPEWRCNHLAEPNRIGNEKHSEVFSKTSLCFCQNITMFFRKHHYVFTNSSGSLLELDCAKHPFEPLTRVETRDQAGDLAAPDLLWPLGSV